MLSIRASRRHRVAKHAILKTSERLTHVRGRCTTSGGVLAYGIVLSTIEDVSTALPLFASKGSFAYLPLTSFREMHDHGHPYHLRDTFTWMHDHGHPDQPRSLSFRRSSSSNLTNYGIVGETSRPHKNLFPAIKYCRNYFLHLLVLS
jgi:hypothetical protein